MIRGRDLRNALSGKIIATNTMSNFLKDANTIDKSKTEKVYNKLNTT